MYQCYDLHGSGEIQNATHCLQLLTHRRRYQSSRGKSKTLIKQCYWVWDGTPRRRCVSAPSGPHSREAGQAAKMR